MEPAADPRVNHTYRVRVGAPAALTGRPSAVIVVIVGRPVRTAGVRRGAVLPTSSSDGSAAGSGCADDGLVGGGVEQVGRGVAALPGHPDLDQPAGPVRVAVDRLRRVGERLV